VRSSLERAGAARRDRPAMARQARAWGAAGAVAWALACRASGRRTPVLAGLLWWLAVWQMLDWHLGMAEGGDGRPRERLSAADAVTLARFWLVPAAPAAARSPAGLPALIAAGGLTDWLDGELARRRGRTRLGRDLDTTADLAFLVAVAVSARRAGRLGAAGFWALAGRHGLGFAFALGAVFGRARRPAVRARPWDAALRIGGLVAHTAGLRRSGGAVLVAGCLVPPRSTAREHSLA
jgi:phosphatidylglycerophosphate synthase